MDIVKISLLYVINGYIATVAINNKEVFLKGSGWLS